MEVDPLVNTEKAMKNQNVHGKIKYQRAMFNSFVQSREGQPTIVVGRLWEHHWNSMEKHLWDMMDDIMDPNTC